MQKTFGKIEMLNIWGTVNSQNYLQKCQDTKQYGHQRLQLGIYCSKILQRFNYDWWLDTGNLLGSFRDGKMIAHDDDFDLGALMTQQEFYNLFNQFSQHLDSKFKCRLIKTYALKIQIYDAQSGAYFLQKYHNYMLHNVTVNIQLYTRQPNNRIKMMYFYKDYYDFVPLFQDYILPVSTLKYCGHMFNVPNKLVTYLQTLYGYIGIGAIYNPTTRKYQDKKQISKKASKKADQGNHDDLKYQ